MILFKAEMETYKDREDLIIMFTDSYDVVLLAEPETILVEFYKMKANLVKFRQNCLGFRQQNNIITVGEHDDQIFPIFVSFHLSLE